MSSLPKTAMKILIVPTATATLMLGPVVTQCDTAGAAEPSSLSSLELISTLAAPIPQYVPDEWLGEFTDLLPRQATEPGLAEIRDVRWVEPEYKGFAISPDDLSALSEDVE